MDLRVENKDANFSFFLPICCFLMSFFSSLHSTLGFIFGLQNLTGDAKVYVSSSIQILSPSCLLTRPSTFHFIVVFQDQAFKFTIPLCEPTRKFKVLHFLKGLLENGSKKGEQDPIDWVNCLILHIK